MTPEGKVKERVKRLLKEHGVWYCMPLGQTFGRSGVPDILACVNGLFVGIECKAGKNKATPLQVLTMEEICRAGGLAFVINEDGLGFLNDVLNDLETRDD